MFINLTAVVQTKDVVSWFSLTWGYYAGQLRMHLSGCAEMYLRDIRQFNVSGDLLAVGRFGLSYRAVSQCGGILGGSSDTFGT